MADAAAIAREEKLQLAKRRLKKFQRNKAATLSGTAAAADNDIGSVEDLQPPGMDASADSVKAAASIDDVAPQTMNGTRYGHDNVTASPPLMPAPAEAALSAPALNSPDSASSGDQLTTANGHGEAATVAATTSSEVQRCVDEINTMRAMLLTERQLAADHAKDYQKVIQRLRDQLGATQQQLSAVTADAAAAQQQRQAAADTERRLHQLDTERAVQAAKLADFKRELETAFGTVSQLQTEKAQLQAATTQLQRQLADAAARRDGAEEARTLLQAKQSIVEQLNRDLAVMRDGAEEMRLLLLSKQQTIEQLSADCRHQRDIEAQMVDMRVEMDAQRDEVARLRDALAEQERLKLVADEGSADTVAQLRAQVQQLTDECKLAAAEKSKSAVHAAAFASLLATLQNAQTFEDDAEASEEQAEEEEKTVDVHKHVESRLNALIHRQSQLTLANKDLSTQLHASQSQLAEHRTREVEACDRHARELESKETHVRELEANLAAEREQTRILSVKVDELMLGAGKQSQEREIELATEREKSRELSAQIKELERGAGKQVEELQSQLSSELERSRILSAKIKEMELEAGKQSQELQAQLVAEREQLRILNARIQELELGADNQSQELRSQLAAEREQSRILLAKITDLEQGAGKQTQELQAQLLEERRQTLALSVKIEELEQAAGQQSQELVAQRAAAQEQARVLSAKVEEMQRLSEQKASELRDEIESARNAATLADTGARVRIAELQSELERSSEIDAELRKELQQREQQLTEREKAESTALETANSLQRDLDSARDTVKAFVSITEQVRLGDYSFGIDSESHLHPAVSHLRDALLAMRSNLVATNNDYDAQSSELAAGRQQLDDMTAELTQLRLEHSKQYESATATSNELQRALQELEETKKLCVIKDEHLEVVEQTLETVRREKNELNDEIDRLIGKIEDVDTHRQTIVELQETVAELRNQIAAMQLQLDQAKKSLDGELAKNKLLNEQVHSLTAAMGDLTAQLKAATAARQDLLHSVNELKLEHAKAKAAWKVDEDKFVAQLANSQRHERDYKLAESRARKLEAEVERGIREAEKERERTAASIDMLEHLLADERERNAELKQRLESGTSSAISAADNRPTSDEMARLHAANAELTHLVKSATEQAEHSYQSVESLRARAEQLELELAKERQRSENIRSELEKAMLHSLAVSAGTSPPKSPQHLALDELAGRISGSMRALVHKVKETEQSFAVNPRKLPEVDTAAAEMSVMRLKDENSLLRNRCTELEATTSQLKADVESVRQQRDMLEASVAARLPEHEHANAAASDPALVQQLYTQLEAASAEITQLTREVDTLRQKNNQILCERDNAVGEFEREIGRLRESMRVMAKQESMISPGEVVPSAPPLPNDQVLQQQLRQQKEEVAKLVFSLSERQDYIAALERQTGENAQSIAQAEKTINLLNDELERRFKEIAELRKDRDELLSAQAAGADDKPSPVHSNSTEDNQQLESTFKATAATVQSIDELMLRLSAVNPVTDGRVTGPLPDSTMYGDRMERCVLLVEEVLKCVEDIKAKSTSNCQPPPQVDSIAIFLERLTQEFGKMQSVDGKRYSDSVWAALLNDRTEEVIALRSALQKLSDSNNAKDTTDQVAQLQNVWEHEVRSNDVLRQLLNELRIRMNDMEQELAAKSDQLRILQSGSQDVSELQREVETLRVQIRTAEQTTEAIQARYAAEQSQWRQEKAALNTQAPLHGTEEVERLRAEKELLATTLADSRKQWTAQKLKWSEELTGLKERSRADKDELLQRFQRRIAQYETLLCEQRATMEQLQSHGASRNTQPNDDIPTLKKEIAALRAEQHTLNENLTKERQSHAQVLAQIQQQQHQPPGSSPMTERRLQLEREKHHSHCRLLVSDITMLKSKYRREAGYRADLIYQKNYLLLIMGGLEECERSAQRLISNMSPNKALAGGRQSRRPSPSRRWRRAIVAVTAICRMRLLAQQWSDRDDGVGVAGDQELRRSRSAKRHPIDRNQLVAPREVFFEPPQLLHVKSAFMRETSRRSRYDRHMLEQSQSGGVPDADIRHIKAHVSRGAVTNADQAAARRVDDRHRRH